MAEGMGLAKAVCQTWFEVLYRSLCGSAARPWILGDAAAPCRCRPRRDTRPSQSGAMVADPSSESDQRRAGRASCPPCGEEASFVVDGLQGSDMEPLLPAGCGQLQAAPRRCRLRRGQSRTTAPTRSVESPSRCPAPWAWTRRQTDDRRRPRPRPVPDRTQRPGGRRAGWRWPRRCRARCRRPRPQPQDGERRPAWPLPGQRSAGSSHSAAKWVNVESRPPQPSKPPITGTTSLARSTYCEIAW